MKSFKPSPLDKGFKSRLVVHGTKTGRVKSLFQDSLDVMSMAATTMYNNSKAKPMLIFHGFAPHGEFLRQARFHSGGKQVPDAFLHDCYGYSPDGQWFKLIKPNRLNFHPNTIPTWSLIHIENLPNKEYQVKAMLLKESF